MKSFFLKISKALRLLRENGMVSGGKIVAGYLKKYFSALSVGSGDVLFVTGGIGDKAHYRAYGVAEELRMHGFSAAVTIADNLNLLSLVDRFEIFVLHKVSYSEKIANFIAKIKEQKKEIIFDTDDLDYDPKYLSGANYLSNVSETEKKEYKKGIGAEIINDPYVKTATTTTSYLADKLREKGKKVFVVSNKISERELGVAQKIIALPKKKDGSVRIGYYSGTPSHNKDFASVSRVLLGILESYENVKLILAGPLDMGDPLKNFKKRVEVLPRVPRDEYYANVYKCDINIIPLELDDPFCESKSEIKFIEAGILGIPSVAVKNRTFSEAITDGEDGFLAEFPDEWAEKMEILIQEKDLRRKMGEAARQKILRDYTTINSHSEKYYKFLKDKLKNK